ncbi:hypothetical protein EV360DRAFT_84982 [Lentinula raphanica]|nr:hypothetical protein EV360DRAFT_84982 [Lentinula raphanica]
MASNVASSEWNARQRLALSMFPTVAQLFLYGVHLSLFILSIFIILARKRRLYSKRTHLLASILLFVACTVSAVARLVFMMVDAGETGVDYSDGVSPAHVIIGLHCFANLVADALLIHRCYHIWTPRKSVLYPPIVGLLANLGIGIAALVNWDLYWLFMLVTLVENLYLTLITAGRIWYINRQSKSMLGSKVYSRYQVIVNGILESGLLYPVVLIITALSLIPPKADYSRVLMFNVMLNIQIQAVGLAQSLIIVRVGFGVDMLSGVGGESLVEISDLEAASPSKSDVQNRRLDHGERITVGESDSSGSLSSDIWNERR